MVNTPAPDAVHALQLNARKRKSPPRDEVETSDEEVTRPTQPPSSSTFGLHGLHRGPRRKLSIDVAAAAAAAAQCYREDSKASSSSPRTPSSARPYKFLRLSVSAPPSPSLSSERQKRKFRKDQAFKRRLYRLYNKRIPSPYSTPTFRFPPPGLSFNSPSPAHTLAHPTAPSIATLPFSTPSSSSSSPVPSPTTPNTSTSFTRPHPPPQPISHNSSSSSPGSGPSRGCLHQSCVAFRFASMMDGVHLSSPIAPHSTPYQGSSRAGPIYVPPILPPINRYTLQELDLEAIMKNPQLREYCTEIILSSPVFISRSQVMIFCLTLVSNLDRLTANASVRLRRCIGARFYRSLRMAVHVFRSTIRGVCAATFATVLRVLVSLQVVHRIRKSIFLSRIRFQSACRRAFVLLLKNCVRLSLPLSFPLLLPYP